MITDEILSFKNTPEPFSIDNYQSRIGDDLSDDAIDIEEMIKIDNADTDEEIIKIDNTDTDEKIIEIDNADTDEEIIEIDNTDIDEKIINIDNTNIDEEIIKIDNTDIDEKITEINDNSNDNDDDSEETIEVKDERSIHIEMINNQISQVNKFLLVKNMSTRNTREIGKLMIELGEGNICDDGIYDDLWLKMNELQKMNILIDEAFDNAWRMIHDKDRKMHKKIDNNKYLKIDRYVDKYTDIINGKIELLNNIGVILDSAMIEIQSKVDMINNVKQKENIDIETLKLIHKTLDEIFKKWMSIISKAFENDIFSKYDMKPDKPDAKKRNTRSKPDKHDKHDKPDKPDKPVTKKDTKPDAKNYTKPDTKKDTKPDTKNYTKPDNMCDLEKHRRILIDMIRNNVKILNLINVHLSKSLENADVNKNKCLFNELCNANKVNIVNKVKSLIAEIYGVNVAIEGLQRGITNRLHIKYINYNRTSYKLLNKAVRTRLNNNTYEKKLQIE